jgi:hypothetical protein
MVRLEVVCVRDPRGGRLCGGTSLRGDIRAAEKIADRVRNDTLFQHLNKRRNNQIRSKKERHASIDEQASSQKKKKDMRHKRANKP